MNEDREQEDKSLVELFAVIYAAAKASRRLNANNPRRVQRDMENGREILRALRRARRRIHRRTPEYTAPLPSDLRWACARIDRPMPWAWTAVCARRSSVAAERYCMIEGYTDSPRVLVMDPAGDCRVYDVGTISDEHGGHEWSSVDVALDARDL